MTTPPVIGFDAETFLILPGLLAPPPVCFSFATQSGETYLHNAERGCSAIEGALDSGYVLCGHNVAFDLAVACAHRPHLIPKVFAAYDRGDIRCSQVRQELIDIEDGLGVSSGDGEEGRHVVVFREKDGKQIKSGRSLADLVFFYFGLDRSHEKTDPNAWRLRYSELANVDPADYPTAAREYAIQDAVDALRVLEAQGGVELRPNELEQLRRAWSLHLLSAWGMRTNGERVKALEAYIEPEYQKLRQQLFAEGFYRTEHLTPGRIRDGKKPETKDSKGRDAYYVRNTKLVQERVQAAYAAQGLKAPLTDPSSRSPNGAIKTDRDTLVNSGDPLLEALGEGGPIGTIRSTFLPTLRMGTRVPINTRFRLLETGRISSSAPNLNNVVRSMWSADAAKNIIEAARKHHQEANHDEAQRLLALLDLDVRSCFEPRDGFVYCSVDYDCAELRALAQVCLWLFGKSRLAEFFQAEPDGDPHLEMAASVLRITSAEAKARKKAGDKQIKKLRQDMKAVNFGYPGGLGADKFMYMARKNYGAIFTKAEAIKSKQQWLARWPELQMYFDYFSQTVGQGGATVMQLRPGGLPHRKRGNVGYCDGCNGAFQALIADGASHALWLASNECYVDKGTALFGSRPVAFLYDELILEVPIDQADAAAHRLRDVMVSAMREWLPDVPVTASPALMDRWYKAAEPVYVDGRLVPWTPPRIELAA